MRRWMMVLSVGAIGAVLLGGWSINWLRVPPRLPAVPEGMTTRAGFPGIPGARYWVGIDIEPFVKDVLAAREREKKYLASTGHEGEMPQVELLAVSGGGDKGAFGAGLLAGWTESGKRPVFKAVTGISTGALIAPFAFAGKEYDIVLRNVYTSLGPEDVASKRSILAAITNDAMADNRPLWDQISRYVDDHFLDVIKQEHEKGRILLVGTTDLDARQPVMWNMGAIAASGAPGALDLFRSILLASAAIPGAFPPSMVKVEVDGKPYEEMHVDGGASAQVFLYPPRMRGVAASMGETIDRKGDVYIIRNSFLRPTWDPVERRTINIAGPAIGSLIHTQGFGDLYRIYATTQRDQLSFNLAYIDSDFTTPHTRDFDTTFMKELFEYGFRQGKEGYDWKHTPPGFDVGSEPVPASPQGVPAG
jgi:predicted acylesterase/phospholipase RssA